MAQTDKSSTINIAIPFELVMDIDMDAIMEIKLGDNPRLLETDDHFDMIMLSGCNLDAIIQLFDIAPYLTLEKTYVDYFHTGVNLSVDFITGLNVDLDHG